MPGYKTNEIFANRYLLLQKLGVGGFSEVWKAQDNETGIILAIKIYAPDKGLDEDGVKLFIEEFKSVFNLKHPHILNAMHYGRVEGSPYLVMPYCSNGSALKLISEIGEDELAKMMNHISSALEYLHNQKEPIIHHDIKPDNFLIDDQGNYLLTDFGISTKVRRTLTRSAGITTDYGGTLPYMPPEQFTKQRKIIPEGDIFSLGAALFELATGELPFGERGGMFAVQGMEMPDLDGDFTERFKKIIYLCLNTNPDARPTAAVLKQLSEVYLKEGYWPDIPEKSEESTQPPEQNPEPQEKAKETSDEVLKGRQTERIVKDRADVNPPKTKKDQEIVPKKPRRNLVWVIILIVVLVLGGIGGGAYYYINNQKNKETKARYTAKLDEGDRYFSAGQFQMALVAYTDAGKILPGDPDAVRKMDICNDTIEQGYQRYFNKGEKFFNAGNDKEAIANYNAALKYKPNDQKAKAMMDQAADRSASAYNSLATECRKLIGEKKYSAAIQKLDEMKAYRPDDLLIGKLRDSITAVIESGYSGAMQKGNAAFRSEEYNAAINWYKNALTFKPNDSEALSRIQDIKDVQESGQSYDNAMALGNDYLKKGDYIRAKEAFQRALSVKPGDLPATEKINQIDRDYRIYESPIVGKKDVATSSIISVEILRDRYTKIRIRLTNTKNSSLSIYNCDVNPNYCFFIKANGSTYNVKKVENIGFITNYTPTSDPFDFVLVFDDIPLSTSKIDLIEGVKQVEANMHWNFREIQLK